MSNTQEPVTVAHHDMAQTKRVLISRNATGLFYDPLLQSPIKNFIIWNVCLTKMSHIESTK